MEKMIAYCGIDCAGCEARQATEANDRAWQERVLAKWQIEYNAPNMTIEFIPCEGCHTTSGCLGGHCKECDIRACGISHNVSTCAECAEFENCERIQGFIAMVPPAAENLRALR